MKDLAKASSTLLQTENKATSKATPRKLITSGEFEAKRDITCCLSPKNRRATTPNPKKEKSKLKVRRADWFRSSLGK
jgi:hypothetical protein